MATGNNESNVSLPPKKWVNLVGRIWSSRAFLIHSRYYDYYLCTGPSFFFLLSFHRAPPFGRRVPTKYLFFFLMKWTFVFDQTEKAATIPVFLFFPRHVTRKSPRWDLRELTTGKLLIKKKSWNSSTFGTDRCLLRTAADPPTPVASGAICCEAEVCTWESANLFFFCWKNIFNGFGDRTENWTVGGTNKFSGAGESERKFQRPIQKKRPVVAKKKKIEWNACGGGTWRGFGTKWSATSGRWILLSSPLNRISM